MMTPSLQFTPESRGLVPLPDHQINFTVHRR